MTKSELQAEGVSTFEKILAAQFVTDAEGREYPLHSNTSIEQCRFLQQLVRDADATSCIEIGLAYGISSLAICEVLAAKPSASFISIDPHQEGAWHGVGLLNLQRAGFGRLIDFHPKPSFSVLPQLLADGRKVQFAYVDSVKVFDILAVDAFYLTALLDVGGVLVFDDCDWPGVRKLVRYLGTMPHFRVVATHGAAPSSRVRRIGSTLAHLVPMGSRIFSPELYSSNESIGIAASCVALQKIAEDSRPWDWFTAF